MIPGKLTKQLEFITEADKLKTILRRTLIMDKSRRENDAEHSWHLALAAMTLYEFAGTPDTDLCRVLKMAVIHDLVEIYAGDTFAYDEKANEDKENREKIAADKLFSILPPESGLEYRALWEEFDLAETPEALYAVAIDRLLPFMSNYFTDGHTWREGRVTRRMVFNRMEPIKRGIPALWSYILKIIDESVAKGHILED